MRRLFIGLITLALMVGAGDVFIQRSSGLEAATPLPSGCYTDASGLPVCGPNYPGPGGTPGPQATPTGGNCIGVSTPPAAGKIDYTCSTPGPQETASPTAVSPVVVASTYPYTIGCTTCSTVTPTPFPTPSPLATSTAGAPSAIWTTAAGNPQLSINFPTGGGGGSGAFPWALKQRLAVAKNSSSTTVAGTYGSTATSGDFLLAVIFFNCSTGSITLSTPAGWTSWGTTCNTTSSDAIQVFYKNSAGTETGISTTASSATVSDVYLYEFASARTPDKIATTNSGASSVNTITLPTLTTPTAGAGVIGICEIAPAAASTSPIVINHYGLGTWTWNSTNFNTGNGSVMVAYYQGTYASATFFYSACIPGGNYTQNGMSAITLSII